MVVPEAVIETRDSVTVLTCLILLRVVLMVNSLHSPQENKQNPRINKTHNKLFKIMRDYCCEEDTGPKPHRGYASQ